MSLSRGEAYAILELPVGADPDSIRRSYKRLVHKWHPGNRRDVENNELFQKFQNASRAYKRLITDSDVASMTPVLVMCIKQLDVLRHTKLKNNNLRVDIKSALSVKADKEMHELYQQVFPKHRVSPAAPVARPQSNGCQPPVYTSGNDTDSDSDSHDSQTAGKTIEGTVRGNGCSLTDEQLEQRRAEKRKAKKKQRKEKKRLEKQTNETSSKETNQTRMKASDQQTKEQFSVGKRINSVLSSDNDDVDEFAAFYSHARHKNMVVSSPPLPSPDRNKFADIKKASKVEPSDELINPVILRSRQLAIAGNEMANNGDYIKAIEYFSEAINLDPSDCRFFGNRSYCYDRLHLFDKALSDAEQSISLSAVWPKGYFRKGRALAGLKMYMEAEAAFKQVLVMDPKCDDAVLELRRLHLLHMTEMGFTQQQAEEALTKHSSFQQALDSLLAGMAGCNVGVGVGTSSKTNSTVNTGSNKSTASSGSSNRRQKSPQRLHPLFINQQNDTQNSTGHSQLSSTAQQAVDVKMDPANPEGLTALWVGNVLPQVSEKKLLQMFSSYGTITSIRSLPDKFCAFINFKDKESASQALLGLQGVDCAGQKLLIKFPDHPLTANSPNRTVGKSSVVPVTRKSELPQRFRKK